MVLTTLLLFFSLLTLNGQPAATPDSNIAVNKAMATAKIYPNPAQNKVEIELKGFEPGFVQLLFTDNNGNKKRNDKRLLINGNEIITVMFSLAPGLYFITLRQNKKMLKKKLLVR